MGRALLIMCLGSIVVFGIVQQAVQNRQMTFAEGNVTTFEVNHARNATNSGLEMGINRVLHNDNWDDIARPWLFPIDDMDIRVFIDRNEDYPNEVPLTYLRVRSEYEIANRSLQSFAFLHRETITPPVDGAVGFYGQDSQLNLSGNAKIYGYDTKPSSQPDMGDGSEADLPGIVSEIDEDSLIVQKGDAATYDGDPPFEKKVLNAVGLNEFTTMYKEQAEVYTGTNMGTTENPNVTLINENYKVKDNINAGGILIVENGATLELRGDFMFEGLVIVEGKLDIRGNVHIFGAMMFSDNALLEIDDPEVDDSTFTGDTSIYYSSQALLEVNDKLSWMFDEADITVNRIFY